MVRQVTEISTVVQQSSIVRATAGAIKITRPLNCLSASGSVILGGYLTGEPTACRLWIAAAVAAVLTAAGNVVNDCFDLDIDRLNKPSRVLPSGQLSAAAAAYWALALVAIGLGLSTLLGVAMALIAVVIAVLLYAYSWRLKSFFLVGNIVISAMSGMTVVYGGMAVGGVYPTLIPALLILFFVFCREILKTVEDYEGDQQLGARTVAVVWGRMGALRVFRVLAVLVVVLSLLPWLLGDVSTIYLMLVIPGVDAVLLLSALILPRRPARRLIRMALAVTKADYVLWIVAMFIGTRVVI
jgi:geranylgeranylglycerol-phosphate geranylgeranyltransferase